MSTGTTAGAREHARAQADTLVEAMATIPASNHPNPPENIGATSLTWAETVAGGGYTSKTLSRGTTIRLTDRDGDACAHVLIFNADQSYERLNVADTVKVPWQAYLGACHPLLSDLGRALATIVADTANGAHDALAATSTRVSNTERYGDGAAHSDTPAARELLKLAAAKHGLDARDLAPSVSFFKRVRVGPEGELVYTGSHYPACHVDLRAELPITILIANAPHRLDPRPEYTCTPLEVLAWRGAPTQRTDTLWTFNPELTRALENTADYAYARGIA
jgi:hypothetical protein